MDHNLPKVDAKAYWPGGWSRKKMWVSLAIGVGLVVGLYVLYVLFFTGPTRLTPRTDLEKKEPSVSLRTQNKNPFDKQDQYVNPFDLTKSAFYSLRAKK